MSMIDLQVNTSVKTIKKTRNNIGMLKFTIVEFESVFRYCLSHNFYSKFILSTTGSTNQLYKTNDRVKNSDLAYHLEANLIVGPGTRK